MTSGDELVKKLVEMAESRHGQHVAKIHSTWSRAIGLSSRRLARRTRYAPNDRLLKTLVVAIVDDRMQFDDFLAEAQRRYGLVIGDAEGKRLVSQKKVDQEALSENRGAAMRRKSFRRESRKSLTVSPLAAMAHLSTRWLRPSAWMRWLMPYTKQRSRRQRPRFTTFNAEASPIGSSAATGNQCRSAPNASWSTNRPTLRSAVRRTSSA